VGGEGWIVKIPAVLTEIVPAILNGRVRFVFGAAPVPSYVITTPRMIMS
jgi:hypothetical protein